MRPTAFVKLATVLLASIPFICAEPTSFNLYHRLYHPSADQALFLERGSVVISENNDVYFQPSSSYAQDLKAFAETMREVSDNAHLALYQVALDRGDGPMGKQWDISSVKVCYLHEATSESIYLHTLDPHSAKPYAIDYFLSPIPHNGACPKKRSTKNSPSPFHAFADNDRLNTTVLLQGTQHPPLPELVIPPPLSAEGAPIVPEPEKSFLQKYWMYILLALFALMVSGGPEEEPRKK